MNEQISFKALVIGYICGHFSVKSLISMLYSQSIWWFLAAGLELTIIFETSSSLNQWPCGIIAYGNTRVHVVWFCTLLHVFQPEWLWISSFSKGCSSMQWIPLVVIGRYMNMVSNHEIATSSTIDAHPVSCQYWYCDTCLEYPYCLKISVSWNATLSAVRGQGLLIIHATWNHLLQKLLNMLENNHFHGDMILFYILWLLTIDN